MKDPILRKCTHFLHIAVVMLTQRNKSARIWWWQGASHQADAPTARWRDRKKKRKKKKIGGWRCVCWNINAKTLWYINTSAAPHETENKILFKASGCDCCLKNLSAVAVTHMTSCMEIVIVLPCILFFPLLSFIKHVNPAFEILPEIKLEFNGFS